MINIEPSDKEAKNPAECGLLHLTADVLGLLVERAAAKALARSQPTIMCHQRFSSAGQELLAEVLRAGAQHPPI